MVNLSTPYWAGAFGARKASLFCTTWAQDVIAGRVVAGPRVKKAWRHNPGDLAKAAYYAVPVRAKLEYTALYLGLAALHALTVQGVPEMLVPG